jgi:enamine deaminase RidA (YjgF/YER057c/UK114 family)
MYQLMTTQSLALAQELDGQISAIAQRHATSQLAKNTLTNLSARPDELLFQAFTVFADVSFLRSGTIEEETRWTLEAVRRVLQEAGADLEDVVKATVFLDDARDFGRYNGVFKEYFPEGNLARSTVEARAVISTKIEIEVVAYKPI